MPPDLRQSDPRRLAGVIDLDPSAQRLWDEADYGAILRHQLAVPLEGVRREPAPGADTASAPGSVAVGLPVVTVGAALLESGSLAQLLLIKDFAKTNATHPDSALPRDVAQLLYYLAIAAGLVRHRQRLTQLGDPDLSAGLRWALSRAWLDPPGRRLIDESLAKLGDIPDNRLR